jgi:hypothetical protein
MPQEQKRLWLTRQHDGSHMITLLRPRIRRVAGTDYDDAYIREGEPVGVRHLCAGGVKWLWGLELKPLESIKVTLAGGLAASPENR